MSSAFLEAERRRSPAHWRARALPYWEMDALFWKPGWRESSDDELFAKVREVTAGPRWVLDGNYSRTLGIKWARVQLVIWLDPSFMETALSVGPGVSPASRSSGGR